MKELEAENARLKRIVANQAIDMAILKQASRQQGRPMPRQPAQTAHLVKKP